MLLVMEKKLDCAGEAIMVLTFEEIVYEHPVLVGGVNNNLLWEVFITKLSWDHDEFSFLIKGGKIPLEAGEGPGPACVVSLETTLVPAGREILVPSGLKGVTKTLEIFLEF